MSCFGEAIFIAPVIQIKYHDASCTRLTKIKKGDWIDLYAEEEIIIKKGHFGLVNLGVVIKLPEGYEAHLAPRSSTFKTWGIIQANSVGVVDESYCGENDVWKFPAIAFKRNVIIHKGDKICQFRIMKKMPEVVLIEVAEMDNENRGGFGSTGTV